MNSTERAIKDVEDGCDHSSFDNPEDYVNDVVEELDKLGLTKQYTED